MRQKDGSDNDVGSLFLEVCEFIMMKKLEETWKNLVKEKQGWIPEVEWKSL